MALTLQAALLLRDGSSTIASAYCDLRLGERRGINYGAGEAAIDTAAILARQGQGI
jgi:hypothetical protein